MNPQHQYIIEEDNRKRSHSSSSSTSSSTNTPELNSFKKKRNTNNYNSADSSSAESSSNPTLSSFDSSTSSFYSTTSSTIPPRISSQRSVPAFLNKLYNMVEDMTTDELVRWSKEGSSFIVEKHEEFAKTVLPRFYKHNTFASFVRQLNMYDFHKVPHIQQGVLIGENEHDVWEFSHPQFKKGRPDLLILVTRKRNKERDTIDNENINITSLVEGLNLIKKQQTIISNDIKDLHRDNEILWQETLSAREKFQKHQEAIQKILQFLTTIFTNDNLAITMNNTDLLPKGLIEEAASLAGMPINKLNMNQMTKTTPTALNSSAATSALSNILSSVVKLYSTQTSRLSDNPRGIDQNQQPDTSKQAPTTDNKPTNIINNDSSVSITGFTQTLNTATRSAQSITHDIDSLQVNIESLANNLGIDPNQFDDDLDLQGNYQQMLKPNYTTNQQNVIELNDSVEDKCSKKNSNKEPQHKLQRQTRDYGVYRNYVPYQSGYSPRNSGFYTMETLQIPSPSVNNPALTSSDNPVMVENPYIVPYFNNNTNEENYDDNT